MFDFCIKTFDKSIGRAVDEEVQDFVMVLCQGRKVQRDSIYQMDSIYILDRGDTVLITQTKYLYRDKLVHDTVYASKIDSVQEPYPVERKLTRWEQFRLDVGSWAIGTVIIVILAVIGYIIYKLKR